MNQIMLSPRKNLSWIVDLMNNNPELEKIKIKLIYLVNNTNAKDKFYKSLIKSISKLSSNFLSMILIQTQQLVMHFQLKNYIN